jgi:hypothetical protein
MPSTDPPPLFPPGSDPLVIANELFADVNEGPIDTSDRERLRIMVALAMLATANDVRRMADGGTTPGPHSGERAS